MDRTSSNPFKPWNGSWSELSLSCGEVHVWAIPVHGQMVNPGRCRSVLDDQETRQADRFHFKKDRDLFEVAHGMLREFLSGYTGIAPMDLLFTKGPHGKPRLVPAQNQRRIFFNLSHAGQMVLLAFALDAEVGVDIERMDDKADLDDVAKTILSGGEQSDYFNLSPDLKRAGFYRAWTRKEALIKATGEGMSDDLTAIEISLQPSRPCQLLSWKGQHPLPCWTLAHLNPAPNYVGAVAVLGEGFHIECHALT